MTTTDTDPPQAPVRITSRDQLTRLASALHMADWHEPDENGVTASVHGMSLGTAGYWPLGMATILSTEDEDAYPRLGIPDPMPTAPGAELYVTLHHEGRAVAYVNLANLLAWATVAL